MEVSARDQLEGEVKQVTPGVLIIPRRGAPPFPLRLVESNGDSRSQPSAERRDRVLVLQRDR